MIDVEHYVMAKCSHAPMNFSRQCWVIIIGSDNYKINTYAQGHNDKPSMYQIFASVDVSKIRFFIGAGGAGNSACQFSKLGLCLSRLSATQKSGSLQQNISSLCSESEFYRQNDRYLILKGIQ